jgi:chromosome partitioning protein
MIVVIGGIKGGTGKTTLATNFAVIGSKLARKVMLVDGDEQRSSMDWAEQREVFWNEQGINSEGYLYPHFPTIALQGKFLCEQLKRFRQDYDDIYVDIGGRDTTSQRSALTIADAFVVPFKPRSLDIWTLGNVHSLIKEVEVINPNLKSYYCLNQADSRGGDNQGAMVILAESAHLKSAGVAIGSRKIFCNAAAMGLGIQEMEKQDDKAYHEIYAVYDCIHTEYYARHSK